MRHVNEIKFKSFNNCAESRLFYECSVEDRVHEKGTDIHTQSHIHRQWHKRRLKDTRRRTRTYKARQNERQEITSSYMSITNERRRTHGKGKQASKHTHTYRKTTTKACDKMAIDGD